MENKQIFTNTLRLKLNIEPHIILFILSAVFLIAGLGEKIAYSNYDTECTAETTGIITEVKRKSGNHGRSSYKWKVSFTAEDGREYSFKTQSTFDKAYVGDHTDVLYKPSDPKKAYAKKVTPDGGAVNLIMAGGLLVAGLIKMRRG